MGDFICLFSASSVYFRHSGSTQRPFLAFQFIFLTCQGVQNSIQVNYFHRFDSVISSASPPHISRLLAPLVHAERRKSSNKMPNHCYLIAGTLTFSSSYLMVVFICQTNVRNTIPQAQSLWHHSQLFLRFPHPPTPPPLPLSPWIVNAGAPSETSAIPQLSVKL